MGRREIIIADGDARYRSQMTDFFRKSGYRVAMADSIEQVLASVQESRTQVLLLGCSFSTKISASDLVHLLKKCSRQLRIIMVSDGMSLAQARKVRQEGIFYHALKPASAGDTDELGQAVACAFEPPRSGGGSDSIPTLQRGPALAKAAGGSAAGESHPVPYLQMIACTVALGPAAGYFLLTSTPGGTSPTVLMFLGFCALIVVHRLLPIFRIKFGTVRVAARHTRHESTPRGAHPRVTPLIY